MSAFVRAEGDEEDWAAGNLVDTGTAMEMASQHTQGEKGRLTVGTIVQQGRGGNCAHMRTAVRAVCAKAGAGMAGERSQKPERGPWICGRWKKGPGPWGAGR